MRKLFFSVDERKAILNVILELEVEVRTFDHVEDVRQSTAIVMPFKQYFTL